MTTVPADPFGWVGHTIAGKLSIEEVVAEGGFGVVYRARHMGLDERVAVKCLKLPGRLEGGARSQFLEAFIAEGKLLHRLSRSNVGIVQALDSGACDSPSGLWTPYLALEWLEGRSLEADLRARAAEGRGARTLAESLALLGSVAQALSAAHEQGVAHRDIKPANIFLAHLDGRVVTKVVDFGIAKVMSDVASTAGALAETGASLRAFTPEYGAPEQFDRSYGATGPWTDVFALALVIVELLVAGPALDGGDTMQLFISSTNPARRPTPRVLGSAVPDGVEAVFARALAVSPGARFPNARAFWDALAAAASAEPALAATRPAPEPRVTVLAEPISIAEPPRRAPAGRSALFPIALAAAAVVGVAVGAVIAFGPRLDDSDRADHAERDFAPVPAPQASSAPLPPSAPAERPSASAPVRARLRPAPDSVRGVPVLAPSDEGFVDTRGGWGWGDRCYLHLQAGELEWAQAACDRAMAMHPASPQPRASLLYNLGMIAKRRGDVTSARRLYEESLALRPNNEVQAALAALPPD